MPDVSKVLLEEVMGAFDFGAPVVGAVRYGCGHINETYLVTTDSDNRYILQKINNHVFPDVEKLLFCV